jgi:hypothetical protein
MAGENQRLSDAFLKERMAVFARHPTQASAARELGIPAETLKSQIKMARERGLIPFKNGPVEKEIILPELPSSELEPEELLEQAAVRYERHQIARDARRWMEIKVKSNLPIGVVFVGDPHLDNNGCNWPLLRRDINIMASTPGMHAVNMGDITDNWIGRLVRLYADQEMSKKQAWKLAAWFLNGAGISWICHLLGNHDAWGDGPYLIKANAKVVPVEDWQSRFQIVFPNDARVRVHASHDFPGSSIWNKMHGPQKASMLQEEADIYACGHKHEWAINESENAARNFVYHLIRARGYKHIDSYADQLGFASQKYGASITAVIDPNASDTKKIRCFPDLPEAADFLAYKRAKAGA